MARRNDSTRGRHLRHQRALIHVGLSSIRLHLRVGRRLELVLLVVRLRLVEWNLRNWALAHMVLPLARLDLSWLHRRQLCLSR